MIMMVHRCTVLMQDKNFKSTTSIPPLFPLAHLDINVLLIAAQRHHGPEANGSAQQLQQRNPGKVARLSQLRGHLKSALTRRMLDFDAADAAADESAWAESAAASDGLTSDDVWRKGSLAVQMMLRWLEVTRLTRREAAAARDASV